MHKNMLFAELMTTDAHPAAVIRATGEDAFTFLQGQFTNELRKPVGAVTYGLWLDQKGKVLADSHVLRVGENEFLIVSAHCPADQIRRRLEDYIVADDVTLIDETASFGGLIVAGARGGATMARIFGAVPTHGHFTHAAAVWIFAGRRIAGEHYEIIGPQVAMADIRARLAEAGGGAIDASELEFARIATGLPAIPADVGPGDLPNEAGLDEVAISYTKGCYLGQEVMARLKNLGQVRRRLGVVRGRGVIVMSRSALYQAEKKVGEIRSVATRGDDCVALAMISLVNFQPALGLSLEPGGPAVLTAPIHG